MVKLNLLHLDAIAFLLQIMSDGAAELEAVAARIRAEINA